MQKSLHPWWYYIYYNQVFSRGKDRYASEVNILASKMGGFLGKSILEIGAGLGGHSREILTYRPSKIKLVDIDPIAIQLLNNRFNLVDGIEITQEDGFKISTSSDHYDRVICMYSLIQQSLNYEEMIEKITSISDKVSSNGVVAFEMIDFEVSKSIYPSNSESIIFEDESSLIKIKSSYGTQFAQINIFGIIEGDATKYEVNFCMNSINKIVDELEENIFSYCELFPLEPNNRRLILVCHK